MLGDSRPAQSGHTGIVTQPGYAPAVSSGVPGDSVRSRSLPGRRRSLLRLLRAPGALLLKTLAVLIPVVAGAVGLLYLRLQHGPISLQFLVEPIQRGLNGEMPGLRFGIEDAIVQLAPGGVIEFRLKNVRLSQDDGGSVAFASLASLELSGSALLSGRIAPARLDLLKPRILLFESDDAPVALSYGHGLRNHSISMPAPSAKQATPAGMPPGQSQVAKLPRMERQQIALGRVIADAAARMRRRVGAASYLDTFGLRDATVVIDNDGRQSVLLLPELAVNLKHGNRRSTITGAGRISTGTQSFGFRLHIDDSEKAGTLTTTLSVDAMTPRALARHLPTLHIVEAIDLPVSGESVLELSRAGEILNARVGLTLKPGRAYLPWLGRVPLVISGGRIEMRYQGDTQRVLLEPSTVRWGGSHVRFKGEAELTTGPTEESAWRIRLEGIDGLVEAEDLNSKALPLERLALSATAGRRLDTVRIDEFFLRAGGAEVSMSGDIGSHDGERRARLEGQIGAMRISAFKAMWPRALAPQTRAWVANHLVTGQIKGGRFRIADSPPDPSAPTGPDRPGRQLSMMLEGESLSFEYLKGLPPLDAARALLRIEGNTAELSVPEATIDADSATRLQLRSGRLTVAGVDSERPLAELSLRLQGPLAGAVNILDRDPIGLMRKLGTKIGGLEGKLDGQFKVKIPLRPGVSIADVVIDGKARITEGAARNVLGKYAMQGATIDVSAQEGSIEANGEMLLGGVLAKVDWRRLLGAPGREQPPLRIRTRLDNAERAQLGLDLDNLVQGEVPLEVTVTADETEEPRVHVTADLTASELMLRDIAWSKPKGRQATLQFDVGKGRTGQALLRNFRLVGENVAMDGWVAMGPDHRPTEFLFPQFSLNTASNLHVQGTFRADRVWDIKARGATYDGNDIFRSLLSFNDRHKDKPSRNVAGIDLVAQIETVQGADEQILKGVRLKLQKRGSDLTAFDFVGNHRNGRTLKARLETRTGETRVIVAEAADAGAALSLLGLYAKMVGGQGRLDLRLDAQGAVEKTGVLTVNGFKVLGDAIVSEVLYTPDDGRPAIQSALPRRGRVVREEFDFDLLRAPFSLGNGQLVIDDARVAGPLIGATLRGKLDFRSRRLQLGGTYIPLSELNRALSALPILGQLVTGPRGEGVLGITFAIQGPMADPQVILNPFSMVAPGIFREIFQMTPQNPQVTPGALKQRRNAPAAGPQIRASPPASGSGQAKQIDGWSSQTQPGTSPAEQR